MQIYREYFAKKLKLALAEAGLNQTELSRRVDVMPPTVSRWCSGEDMPSEEMLPTLTRILNKPKDYFDVNKQSRKAAFTDSAAFLAKYASLSPELQEIVWAIVFEDAELYGELPTDLKRALK